MMDAGGALPHEVVTAHGLDGKSLVRAWREYKGFTQARMAERLGVSRATYARLERPGANLKAAVLTKVAHALGVETGLIQL